MTQGAVLAPVLSQLDGGFLKIAGRFLQLAFKTFKQGDGIGGRTGKASQNFVVVQATSLARGVLHDVVAHGDLSISDKHHFVVLAHTQDRGAVHRRTSLMILHLMFPRGIIAPGTVTHQKLAGATVSWRLCDTTSDTKTQGPASGPARCSLRIQEGLDCFLWKSLLIPAEGIEHVVSDGKQRLL